MPHDRVTTETLYFYGELSDTAKAKARDQWRDMESQDPAPWDYMYDDFIRCAAILGITIGYHDHSWSNVSTGAKGIDRVPDINWSGFGSQGDGASFEGSYAYKAGARKAIRAHAPKDSQLHHIADELQRVQSHYFYALTATAKQRGNNSHEYSVNIEMDAPDWIKAEDYRDAENRLSELMRDFMRWMYRQLYAEYEYRMADEQVAENIVANEYEFTAEGKFA